MLEKLLAAVLEANKLDGFDAFFDFRGHVNKIEIRVNYKCDYESTHNNTIFKYDFYVDMADDEELDMILLALKGLQYEAEERLTALQEKDNG
jgi:hypothetical protein